MRAYVDSDILIWHLRGQAKAATLLRRLEQDDETELWTEPGYFKFILDERFWMDDPYIRIAPAPGDAYNFDETTVTFAMSTTAPTTATPAQASSPMEGRIAPGGS